MPKHFKSTTGWYIFKPMAMLSQNHTFAFMLGTNQVGLVLFKSGVMPLLTRGQVTTNGAFK